MTAYAYTAVDIAVRELSTQCAKHEQRIAELEAALVRVAKAEGPYSRDPLTHCGNAITAMVEVAKRALADDDQQAAGVVS